MRIALAAVAFAVAVPLFAQNAVLTAHHDKQRTGAYPDAALSSRAVSERGMELRFARCLDGRVEAQPLYVPRLSVNGGLHDVVYFATVNNTIYAYDVAVTVGDAVSGRAPRLPNTVSPCTGSPSAGLLLSQTLRDPERPDLRGLPVGIVGTPAIDPATNTMYVVFGTTNLPWTAGQMTHPMYDSRWWLAALDLRTLQPRVLGGRAQPPVAITGSVLRSNGTTLTFEPFDHY